MATWARGVDFKNSTNTTRVGGIGIYGTDTTTNKLYIGLGAEPWNNAGLQLTSSAINFKGNKIYHAGDKPTASEIGAAAASHNHTSLTNVTSIGGAGASSSWGSLNIAGSKGGWAGIHFSDTKYVFLVNNEGHCGIWKDAGNAIYSFDKNGALVTGTVGWDKITGKPSTYAPSSHNHTALIGANDTRSKEYTPATCPTETKVTFQNNDTNGVNDGGKFYSLMHIPRWSHNSGGYGSQFAFTDNENIWYRKGTSDTAWTGWKRIWHSGNFDPNTKFQSGGTYGTVYLTDWFRAKGNTGLYFQDWGGGWYMTDSTWIRAFNGKNIYTEGVMNSKNGFQWNGQSLDSRYAAASHTHNYIPLSGSTGVTGTLRSNSEIQTTSQNAFRAVSGNYGFFIRNDGSNTYFLLTNSGDQYGNWNSLRPLSINNSTGLVTFGNGLKGTLDGNASTATTLQNARTINDVNFNGSSNITIPLKTFVSNVGNDNTKNYHRILSSGVVTGSYADKTIILMGSGNYSGGPFGIVKVILRTNASGSNSNCNIDWMVRKGFGLDSIVCNMINTYGSTVADIFYKCAGAYAAINWTVLFENNGRGGSYNNGSWTKYSTNASGTEVYTETEMKALRSYTSTLAQGSDTTIVNSANKLASGRTLTIGSTGKSFDGTSNVSWSLSEIGAASSSHTHNYAAAKSAGGGALEVIPVQDTANKVYLTGILDFNSAKIRASTPYMAGGTITATTFVGALNGNATTATTLATARTINGTSFNGSANITTANWGTARTITIGNTGKSVNGSGNVSWSLSEIGAAASSHTHSYLPLSGGTITGDLKIAKSNAQITFNGKDTNYYQIAHSSANGTLVFNYNGKSLFTVQNNGDIIPTKNKNMSIGDNNFKLKSIASEEFSTSSAKIIPTEHPNTIQVQGTKDSGTGAIKLGTGGCRIYGTNTETRLYVEGGIYTNLLIECGDQIIANGAVYPGRNAQGGWDCGLANRRFYTVYCVNVNQSSDRSMKEDINYIDNEIELLSSESKNPTPFKDFICNDLKVATYKYKRQITTENEDGTSKVEDIEHEPQDSQIGFIAQDIRNTEVGSMFVYGEDGNMNYSPSGFTTVVAKALQEEIKYRDQEIAQLKEELSLIKEKLGL